MLTMDDINLIRFLYEKKGGNYAEIAKETDFDVRTIKKYIEQDDWNVKPQIRKPKDSKLDPFKEVIDSWLLEDKNNRRKQRHTAKRIHDRLCEEYKDTFDASYRTVAIYVAAKKKEIYSENEGYLPLEHYPWEAQVDFGEADFIEKEQRFSGYYVNISFPNSNGGYTQVFKGANQECLLEGLKNIFEHMNRVPKCIWFDNDTTIVKKIREHGKRDITEGFRRFQLHYGFESNFCNPASGHEKGSIENKVGYHRRNFFVPVPKFADIRLYNKELLAICDNDMNRNHYVIGRKIATLFDEDKKSMLRLPMHRYEVCRYENAIADNYGKVKFNGGKYSSSPIFARREVIIKATAYDVMILDQNYKYIQGHARLYGDKKDSMQWVPYLELMSRRPTALKYTGFFRELPHILQGYFEECDYQQKKASLKLLVKMVSEKDLDTATKAFERALEKGAKDTDSIWTSYYTLTHKAVDIKDLKVPDSTPKLKAYETDTGIYDTLLKKGGGAR